MPNILLSAGHYPQAQGACFEGFCEHQEAKKWVASIVEHIAYRRGVLLVPSLDLAGKVKWINSQEDASLALEVHFNSDPAHAGKGSEALYCPESEKGHEVAQAIQKAISIILSPDRGTKEGWYRMDKPGHEDYPGDVDGDEKPDYFLSATKCTAVIIEPEFIHNKDLIESKRDAVCAEIANALVWET